MQISFATSFKPHSVSLWGLRLDLGPYTEKLVKEFASIRLCVDLRSE